MQHANQINLGGKWRFRLDPQRLGEHFKELLDTPYQYDARWMERTHREDDWEEILVPAHWQTQGYDYNGAAWYRKELNDLLPELKNGERLWLRFEGVDYFSDVWLNDHYLGSHEGYFSAFQYEIAPYLHPERNLLAVRVDSPNDICAKERQRWQLKEQIKGALQRWDMNDPNVNPGGIWNDVILIKSASATILSLRLHTKILDQLPAADPDTPVAAMVMAEVALAGFAQCHTAHDVRLHFKVDAANFPDGGNSASIPVAALAEPCTWIVPLEIQQARLWHTWDIGFPYLYQAIIAVEVDGVVSDQVQCRFGFRSIEQRQGWETYLNGIRFFQRGANYLSDQLLSTMTPARYEKDVHLLKEANLNTVHPFALVEKQSFYDACDEIGILVYQDFPMWLEMSNSSDLVRRAVRQLEELIEQYGHHPSICIWNFGSQPSVANFTKLCSALKKTALHLDPSRIAHQANSIIDPTGKRYDPLGDFFWKDETIQDFCARFDWRLDTHLYQGWYYQSTLADLDKVPKEYLQLVTEYGAQALPRSELLERIIPKEGLFPPDWPYYTQRCFQPEHQFDYIPQPQTLEQFIADSQAYQAQFIQYHTEYYRRHKFNPCNGIHLFCFNDCWPSITWSVVDYDRVPKQGFYALQRAMAPLQVFVEHPYTMHCEAIKAKIWLVNDLPHPFEQLVIHWKICPLQTKTPVSEGSLECRAEANTLMETGMLVWQPPTPGSFEVFLEIFQAEKSLVQNRYLWQVLAA